MFYFNGCSCAVCGKEFTEKDDIVACPVCGSPQHRSCYKENGGCGNESLHDSGYSWTKSADSENKAADGSAESSNVCGICGTENPNGRLFCQNCGKPLSNSPFGENPYSGSEYDSFNRQQYDFSEKEMIGDVPFTDINRFLGNSSIIYSPIFYRLNKLNKKVSFNPIALFFPAFWFISRKMYFRGILIILYNLFNYCYSLFFYDVYEKIYSAAMDFDSDAIRAVFFENPEITGGFLALGIISYVILIASALFGNRIYMNWSVRRIRQLRKASSTPEEFGKALDANARSNMGITIVIMLVYFILTLAAERFIV